MVRTPNYATADTTVKGLKTACKVVGIMSSGKKLDLIHELSDAWESGAHEWPDAVTQETAYACWFAEVGCSK